MTQLFRRVSSLLLVVGLLLAMSPRVQGQEADIFAGLFGKAEQTSREIIPRGNGAPNLGYRMHLHLPDLGPAWDAYRRTIPVIAEKQLRMAGYEVVLSNAIFLDLTLPAMTKIAVRKSGKMLYFSSMAINGGKNGCFLTYEVTTDP